MTTVQELGYLGIEAADFGAWRRFAVDILGLQPGNERTDGALTLRLDDRVHRLIITPGPADDMVFAGYDCGSETNLEALAARLRAEGLTVEEDSEDLARARGVRRVLATHDPVGNRVELYVDLASAELPFRSDLVPSGFVTGNGGLGHLFLPAADRQAMIDFYALLGFSVSDYIRQEIAPGIVVDAAFMHCNGRHHTVAFAIFPFAKKLQHVMLEVSDRSDVGCAYDRVLNAKAPLAMTLGDRKSVV